jgi:RHS repeat-associated protein
VLADGANRYLYGMGRIAQQTPGGWQYFLPDALGSARQLSDAAGALALAQSFDPYGGLLSSQGSAMTPYGFAGEWGDDASGLIYLRARYYLPQADIFTARDPFPGVTRMPVTLQPYLYAAGNPLRYTDPSGENPLLLIGALGGLLGGALYGYGSQVFRNLNQNHFCLWDALTTQIDVNSIAFYAVTGIFLGTGIGVIGMGAQALMGYFGAKSVIGTAAAVESIVEREGNPTDEISGIAQAGQKFIGIIYRNASGTPASLTPRPGVDDIPGGGLSFWNSVDKLNSGKYISIDASKLENLIAILDEDLPGHIIVIPSTFAELQEWAATRGTETVHALTQELIKLMTFGKK